MKEIQIKHDKMLYPTVRVRTGVAGGSGTVIYCKQCPGKEGYETYVLTNCHVVDSNIKIEKKWSSLLKREIKVDVLSECSIEFFDFEYGSWESGHLAYKGDIVCYDKDMDIALLKLKSEREIKNVVTLFPKDMHKERLRMFQPLFAIGCGLGHPPLVTQGVLTGFTDVIDNHPYFLSSAATIFGNSGGAVFLADSYEFVGIPSRISVNISAFSADAITHMSYFIPITSIYKFFDDQMFHFIYNSSVSSEDCRKARKEKRDRDERMLAVEAVREDD